MSKERPVIAVTGGAQGIGKAILVYFAERGYDCALLDVDTIKAAETAELLQSYGSQILNLECNVADTKSVNTAYNKIHEHFGRLDIQVNNAGILLRERIMDATDEVSDRMIDINLRGVLNTSRAAIRIMRQQGHGLIINAHSILGSYPDTGLGVYSATKAAVAALTRVLAAECAPYNIRVNGYAPCVTRTRMTENIIETRPLPKLAQIPMRQFGTPEQIAKICWFFASDLCEYTTGASIPVDGGAFDVQRPEQAWIMANKL